jgi:hypothetical protein
MGRLRLDTAEGQAKESMILVGKPKARGLGVGRANRFAGGLVVALNGADETSFVERKRGAGGDR